MSAEDKSSGVVAFKPRGSYLQAARDQGVYVEQLETQAELAAIMARRDAFRVEADRLAVALSEDPPVAMLEHSAMTEPFAEALKIREAELLGRLKTICERYADAGCGDAYFPLLMVILFDTPLPAEQTLGLFEAARRAAEPSSHDDQGKEFT